MFPSISIIALAGNLPVITGTAENTENDGFILNFNYCLIKLRIFYLESRLGLANLSTCVLELAKQVVGQVWW